MSNSSDAITRLVRACEPNEALHPDDKRYVNCDDVRGESLVDGYVRALRRADPTRPQVKLFAGHRGVGKSSELFRLKARLEEPLSVKNVHRPFNVIYMDTSERLDLNDLDLPDLLVFVAAGSRSCPSRSPSSPRTTRAGVRSWTPVWPPTSAYLTRRPC